MLQLGSFPMACPRLLTLTLSSKSNIVVPILRPSAKMDAKRRRHETKVFRGLAHVDCAGAGASFSELAENRQEAGRALRKWLLRKYVLGKFVAEDVTLIAHYHVCAGGCGLADLALPPSRTKGHAHHLETIMRNMRHQRCIRLRCLRLTSIRASAQKHGCQLTCHRGRWPKMQRLVV